MRILADIKAINFRGLFLAFGILLLAACGSAASASSEIELSESVVDVADPADAVEFFNEETSVANDRGPNDDSVILDLEDFRVEESADAPEDPAVTVEDSAAANQTDPVAPEETAATGVEIIATESAATPAPIVHPTLETNLSVNLANEVVVEASLFGCDNGRDYEVVFFSAQSDERQRIDVDCEAVGSYHIQRTIGQFDETTNVVVRIGLVDLELDERVIDERSETTVEVEALNAIPADSGAGRRIVYDRRNPSSANRYKVWLVDSVNGQDVIHAFYEVRGNPRSPFAGTYEVTTRSTHALSGERQESGSYQWQSNHMVRFIEAGDPIQGNDLGIGFHGIPFNPDNPTQQLAGPNDLTDHESAGCIRQNNDDALTLWNFVNDSFNTTAQRTHFSNGNSTPVVVLG